MNAILVCLVAALCTVQIADVKGDSLSVLRAQLQKAKGQVNIVVNDLTRSKNNLQFDLKNRLFNVKLQSMQSVNDITNPAMNEIRNAVNAAKEAGKDATLSDRCLESGRLALRDISTNAYAAIDSCLNNAMQGIVPVQNNMDSTIAIANQLNGELDRIFPNCYTSNILQMQSCIAIALGKSNITIRSLQSTADAVKSSGATASNSAFNQGSACFRDVVSSTRPKAPPVVASAKNCISNV